MALHPNRVPSRTGTDWVGVVEMVLRNELRELVLPLANYHRQESWPLLPMQRKRAGPDVEGLGEEGSSTQLPLRSRSRALNSLILTSIPSKKCWNM